MTFLLLFKVVVFVTFYCYSKLFCCGRSSFLAGAPNLNLAAPGEREGRVRLTKVSSVFFHKYFIEIVYFQEYFLFFSQILSFVVSMEMVKNAIRTEMENFTS